MKKKMKLIGRTIMQLSVLLIVFFCMKPEEASAATYEDGLCMIGVYDSAGNPYAIGTGFVATTDYGDIVITTTENYYDSEYDYYALTDYGSTSLTIDIEDEDCGLFILTMDQYLSGITPFILGYVSDLTIGDTVYALGYDFSLLSDNSNVSDCAIAVESTVLNEELNDDFNYIELNNYMDDSTLGGPLLAMDAQGSLVVYGVMSSSNRMDFAIEANYLLYTYSPEDDTDNGGSDAGQTPSSGTTGQTPSSGTTGQTPSSGTTGQTPSSGTTGQTPSGGTSGGTQTPAVPVTSTSGSGSNSGVIWIVVTVAAFLVFGGIAVAYIMNEKKKKKAAYAQNNMGYGAPYGQPAGMNQMPVQQPFAMNQSPIQQPPVNSIPAQAAAPIGGGSIVIRGVNGVYAGQAFNCTDVLCMGRDAAQCNIMFPNGVPGISGVHARLRNLNGMVEITDLNSTYGTFKMDGTRLQPQVPYIMGRGEQFYLASPDNMFCIE